MSVEASKFIKGHANKGIYRRSGSARYRVEKIGPYSEDKKGQKGNFWRVVTNEIMDAAGVSVRGYRMIAEKMLIHARNRIKTGGDGGDAILPLCPTTRQQWQEEGRSRYTPFMNTGGFVSSMGIRTRRQDKTGFNFSFGWYATTRPDTIVGTSRPQGVTVAGPNSPGGERYSDLARLFVHGKPSDKNAVRDPQTRFSFFGVSGDKVKPKTRQYPTQYHKAPPNRPHAWGFPPRPDIFPSPEKMQEALMKAIKEIQQPGKRIKISEQDAGTVTPFHSPTDKFEVDFGNTKATREQLDKLQKGIKKLSDPGKIADAVRASSRHLTNQQYDELARLFGVEDL